MEIGDEIVQLLRSEGAASGGHHVAAVEDGLADEAFVGGQAAGQERFLEEALEAGAVFSRVGVCVVTGGACLPIDVAATRLLGVQPELRVGLRRIVVIAAAGECHKRERSERDEGSIHAAIIF